MSDSPETSGYHFHSDDPEERIAQLEQELKLLHWHKLANDAALKAALIRTKKLDSKDSAAINKQRQREKAAWMAQVIQEEQSKPLKMTAEFVRQHEEQEAQYQEQLDKEINRHVENLKALKDSLVKKEAISMRRKAYVAKKKGLAGDMHIPDDAPPDFAGGSAAPGGKGVVDSLDRLVQLEKRIAMLEGESALIAASGEKRRAGVNLSIARRKKALAGATVPPQKGGRKAEAGANLTAAERRAAMRTQRRAQNGDQPGDKGEWLKKRQEARKQATW